MIAGLWANPFPKSTRNHRNLTKTVTGSRLTPRCTTWRQSINQYTVTEKITDLNLDFSLKSHASNHFSTRCMMDYHGLKSLNNFQHLIFTVSEAFKSTANNGRPPVQNSPKVVVLNLDFSIKNSTKKQISTWLLIPIRTWLGSMRWHRGRTK